MPRSKTQIEDRTWQMISEIDPVPVMNPNGCRRGSALCSKEEPEVHHPNLREESQDVAVKKPRKGRPRKKKDETMSPCPFCGSEARVVGVENPWQSKKGRVMIQCPMCLVRTGVYFDESHARDAWNRRVDNMPCPDEPRTMEEEEHDAVNAPSHYCKGGYEIGPMLYLWGLSHRRASAVEYIMRAGAKKTSDEVEDLRKAIRNLEMELEYMEKYGEVR